MSVIVHVAETAFMSILVSAIDSFPSRYCSGKKPEKKPKRALPEGEVYGLLFGQRMGKEQDRVFNVTIATPMQILKAKTSSEVAPSLTHFERIREVVEAYPMFQFLGTFHSHPWRKEDYKNVNSADASKSDKESLIADAESFGEELIEVILGLTHLQKTMSKEPDNRWSCILSYCGNFKYCIAAYVTDRAQGKVELVDNLLCPLAAGVGAYDLQR